MNISKNIFNAKLKMLQKRTRSSLWTANFEHKDDKSVWLCLHFFLQNWSKKKLQTLISQLSD